MAKFHIQVEAIWEVDAIDCDEAERLIKQKVDLAHPKSETWYCENLDEPPTFGGLRG
jgi:hypothetical protein